MLWVVGFPAMVLKTVHLFVSGSQNLKAHRDGSAQSFSVNVEPHARYMHTRSAMLRDQTADTCNPLRVSGREFCSALPGTFFLPKRVPPWSWESLGNDFSLSPQNTHKQASCKPGVFVLPTRCNCEPPDVAGSRRGAGCCCIHGFLLLDEGRR